MEAEVFEVEKREFGFDTRGVVKNVCSRYSVAAERRKIMKKIFITVLCVMMVFTNLSIVFAESASEIATSVHRLVQLNISESEADLEIMRNSHLDSYGFSELNFDKDDIEKILREDNALKIRLSITDRTEKINYVSGNGTIRLGQIEKSFKFNDVQFEKMGKFSAGCISVPLFENEEPMLIDVVEMNDFSKVIATTSYGTLEKGVGTIFWGDMFEEYDNFYDLQMTSIEEAQSQSQPHSMQNNAIASPSESEKPSYAYAGKSRSSSISGGSGGSGETATIVVGKRDFRDGKATNGYEMVRVFSNTWNAKTYIADATTVYPVKAQVDFTCTTPNFLDVDDVAPKSSYGGMKKEFEFISALHPIPGIVIATVKLLHYQNTGSVNYTIDATSGHSFDNHANVEIDTNLMSNNDLNLPYDTSYADAEKDTAHGVCVEIKYDKYNMNGAGTVVSKGRIQYRFYYSTHRYTSAYTSYASVSHSIYA